MKYETKPELYKDNYIWSVFETESEQVVARFKFEVEARRETKRQNRGIPWNGWTPTFFLLPEVKVI